MISFHRNKSLIGNAYAKGFETADTDDLVRIAKGIVLYPWSGIIWKGGVRHQSNFLQADLAVLDFDDGELTLEDARRRFCDMRHIIGPTKSHTEKHHRFRVVVPFEGSIVNLRVYRYNMALLCNLYDSDQQCKDGARYFFPCKSIFSLQMEGDALPIRNPPEEFEAQKPNKLAQLEWQRYGRLPTWTDKFLKRGETFKDHGRQTSAFMVACAMKLAGVPKSEAYSLVLNAPISWENFAERELLQAVDSAYKR